MRSPPPSPVSLVGLAIAIAIVLLANTDDDVRRGIRDPRLETELDVLWLTGEVSDRLLRRFVRDDDESQPLAVPGARNLSPARDNPLERLAGDRLVR